MSRPRLNGRVWTGRGRCTAVGVWCLLLLGSRAIAQTRSTAGTYTDRQGASHMWSVSASHALMWDGQPYWPIGGRFVPRVMAEGESETNWKRDEEDLALLRDKGIEDILIDPVTSAVRIPAATWQRLVDLLESHGFRYGISFGHGVDSDLTGTVVNPGAYRVPDLQSGSEAAWDVPDAFGGWYVIADARDGTQVVGEGKALARSGRIAVTVASRSAESCVALLYPRKSVGPGPSAQLPDLWSAFDLYRDRLLQVFGQVRFGAGLRFFLDPLGNRLGIRDEAEYLIPDSPAWRLEWEAFLSRKYSSPTALAAAWGLLDRDINDFKAAASLIPLWFRNKGVPFLLDPATGKRRQVSGAESRFWADFRQCRDESIAYYMQTAASLVKREIASVPVVYTHTLQHRMFVAAAAEGGADGLGGVAYGGGVALAQSGVGAAYSQVTDAERPLWFIVTETCDPTGISGRPGYASREALSRDMDWLFGSGARGVFVRSLREGSRADSLAANLIASPEQLEWLAAYRGRVAATGSAVAVGPRTLPYPAAASGLARPGPIGNGSVWWVPSLAPGRALDFGPSYGGYAVTLPEGESIVLWSLTGPRETHLYVADPRRLTITTPEGSPVPVRLDVKGKTVQVAIPETPIVIRSHGQEVFPVEAIADSLQQLRALVAQAQSEKIPVQDIRYLLEAAEARFRRKDMPAALTMAKQGLDSIVELMQPYSWREVEHAQVQTFTEVVPLDGASGGMYLALNTAGAPPRDGYSFQVRFKVPADDTYTVWLACSPPGSAVSPFAWVVDAGDTYGSDQAKPVGPPYAGDRLGWVELGKVNLKAGNHTFTLRVTDRAVATGTYSFAADVLLVTRMPFTPMGTARPPAVAVRH